MWQIEVRHDGLNKYQMIRGQDQWAVEQRATALRAQWDETWAKKQARNEHIGRIYASKWQATDLTAQAQAARQGLQTVLSASVGHNYELDWDGLKKHASFDELPPATFLESQSPEEPTQPRRREPILTFLEVLFPPLKRATLLQAEKTHSTALAEYELQLRSWEEERERAEAANIQGVAEYETQLAAWKDRRQNFLREQAKYNETVDVMAAASREGQEIAVKTMLELALGRAELPEPLTSDFELDYAAITKSAIIDFLLPSPDQVPTANEFRFVQTRDEIVAKHISDGEKAKLYDDLLYQTALRTIYVAFAADPDGHLQRVTFNGWVDYVHKGTGMDERSCILTVAANRSDLAKIDLQRVDPKECFKALRGVAASKLIGLAPVAPLERPKLADSRFIAGEDVTGKMEAGINVAAMDWKDFEHLVRQVFENEFSSANTEVRVTQASRDGGVDAIVFDPDPIKGGKIVIQAKRYTNTVEVSAVRDLYGTVMNEGASKGILVTTSHFGPDARKFAQGKPLTLIDGGNFLFLLERMGVKARIDLKEAKATLATA